MILIKEAKKEIVRKKRIKLKINCLFEFFLYTLFSLFTSPCYSLKKNFLLKNCLIKKFLNEKRNE